MILGKSNICIISALGILLLVLILNYNRCYVNNSNAENFESIPVVDTTTVKNNLSNVQPTNIASNVKFPTPKDVRVSVTPNSCTLNFTNDISEGTPMPIKYLVVLAQYDKNKKYVGTNRFYLSDEYLLDDRQALNPATTQNLCTIVNGFPSCSYTFNNLTSNDINGDPYFYKIGISSIYKDGNSDFVIPGNILNNYFILDTSIDAQTKNYQDYLKYKSSTNTLNTNQQNLNNDSILSTADGQYEIIKLQLGNYPNNLEISDQEIQNNTLSDLIDKSMSLGKIFVNVSSPTTTQSL